MPPGLQATARGWWEDDGSGCCAEATYDHFVLRPVSLLGLPLASLPPLDIGIPSLLRSHGMWSTTYVDTDLRVARANEAVFLFKRAAAA